MLIDCISVVVDDESKAGHFANEGEETGGAAHRGGGGGGGGWGVET